MSIGKLLMASAALTAATLSADIIVKTGEKVAFLGDSLTQFGNRPYGFVHLVMDGLKRSGIDAEMIPAGVSGNKSNDVLKRLHTVLAKKPDWIVFQIGTNDVGWGKLGVKLPDYKVNMTKILDRCRDAGAKVILVTPTMHTEQFSSKNNITLLGYCDFVREQAAARNLPLVDWNKRMRAEITARKAFKGNKLTIDNLHLNGYGNRCIAMAILETMGAKSSEIEKWVKEWNKLPSMAPVVNSWSDPKYIIQIDDYELLLAEATKKRMTVEEYVKKTVADKIAELRKSKKN